MASIVTLAPDKQAFVASALSPRECAYCRAPILSGERWVREKIYESLTANVPRYHRYHADLFDGEHLSCWEKHQVEQQAVQAAERAAHALT